MLNFDAFFLKFLLPSHLVISTLQIYSLFVYENTPSESSVRIQELCARLLNIILTRYSKKFANLAGLVTSLLARLLGSVTLFANQSTLRNDQDKINLAIKAAQNLER